MEQPEPWGAHTIRVGADLLEVECPDPFDYGKLFARLWNRGDPFVIVEHDVIPWPGAIGALIECPELWCTHRYPLHRGNVCLSFGIGKYRPTGPAPEHWAETRWDALDGQVVPHLNKLFGHSHVHEPPVAHARAI
jgi:hypothetical protein